MKTDNMKNEKIKEQGFTLIEIIIAMGLLAFGLLAMASMQVMAIKTNGKANRITEATTIAMDNLEQLRIKNDFGNAIDNAVDFPLHQGKQGISYTVQVPAAQLLPDNLVNSLGNAQAETVTVTISGGPLSADIILNGIRTSGI